MSDSCQQRPSYDELAALVEDQAALLTGLQAEIVALRAENAELRAEVTELSRRLGMGSSNSSKPPSSDGLDRKRRSSSLGSRGQAG